MKIKKVWEKWEKICVDHSLNGYLGFFLLIFLTINFWGVDLFFFIVLGIALWNLYHAFNLPKKAKHSFNDQEIYNKFKGKKNEIN